MYALLSSHSSRAYLSARAYLALRALPVTPPSAFSLHLAVLVTRTNVAWVDCGMEHAPPSTATAYQPPFDGCRRGMFVVAWRCTPHPYLGCRWHLALTM